IQRLAVLFWTVPCWNTVKVPPGGVARSSYQRDASVAVAPAPGFTVWLRTIASWSPKLRYAARYINRSPRESSFSPGEGCAMQARVAPQICVQMEIELFQRRIAEQLGKVVGRARGRRGRSVHVRRQETVIVDIGREAHADGGAAGQHRIAVECARLGSVEAEAAVAEGVDGNV